MEFFDKLGKKASEAYKITADKTGKLAKEAKIKLKIGELKSQINDIYEEIGKNVYQNHVNKETINLEEKIEEDCTRIDIISAEIEAKLKECLELRDRKQCPNCYTEMDKDVKFCPECGAKQEQEEAKEVEIIDDVEIQNNEKENDEEKKDESKELNNNEESDSENEEKNNNDQAEENDEEHKENLQKAVEIEANVQTEEIKDITSDDVENKMKEEE